MYQIPAPDRATLEIASPTMRALYLQQLAADAEAPARSLVDIIAYDRPAAERAPVAPVELSQADIVAAAAYNLVSDARGAQGDVLSLLKG